MAIRRSVQAEARFRVHLDVLLHGRRDLGRAQVLRIDVLHVAGVKLLLLLLLNGVHRWHHVDLVFVEHLLAFLHLLALLGSAILEPDFHLFRNDALVIGISARFGKVRTYLTFRQAENVGQLRLPSDGDVTAVVELFFEL